MNESIVDVIKAIDKMAKENPSLGERFVEESRIYWAAKKEVFQYGERHASIIQCFPYLMDFHNSEEYMEIYGDIVYDTLFREALQGKVAKEAKRLIKYVRYGLEKAAPEDNTILPLVAVEGRLSILLPNDQTIELYEKLVVKNGK